MFLHHTSPVLRRPLLLRAWSTLLHSAATEGAHTEQDTALKAKIDSGVTKTGVAVGAWRVAHDALPLDNGELLGGVGPIFGADGVGLGVY